MFQVLQNKIKKSLCALIAFFAPTGAPELYVVHIYICMCVCVLFYGWFQTIKRDLKRELERKLERKLE